jgi:DNA polymerase I-like protein with 3'-5' exonuclease and polymerase domains
MTFSEEASSYLPTRAVLTETATQFQVEVVATPSHDQLTAWLGHDGYVLEAAVVFPNLVVDADTAKVSVHNHYVRCFPAPVGADGKERKFLSTLGSTYRPYILPPVLDGAYDTSQAIYLVEKQTAALLFHQNGLAAIALDGTWGAAAKREEGQPVKLHTALAEFDWIGRPVYLCFDSDFRARTSVLQGLIRAYLLLSVAGAVVKLLQWDPLLKGIDDFIAAKAGLDLAKQRAELDTLTLTVSGLSASVASRKWIIPQYRILFEREMATIVPGMAERSQLAECIHEALGTTAGDLKKSWGASVKAEPDKAQKTPTYPVPEVRPDPVDYSEVMANVLSEFRNPRFAVITNEQAVVCTLHTLTTYLTEYLDDWLHFLYITSGAKESGKTRLLCLFFELCYWASLRGDPTAPAIYYDLQEGPHTILIDEVDKKEQSREAILDLINYSTTRRTAWVSRVDMDAKRVVYFPTFCPKILAGMGLLRGTTASRCIEIQMLKKRPGGPRIRMKKEDVRRFAEHRSQMIRIASEIGPGLSDYDIDTLKLPSTMSDREADNWTLLFLTAELVGGLWPNLLRKAFYKLCPPKNPDAADDSPGESELGETLVRDIARIWVETPTVDFYASEFLQAKLRAMKDKSWPGMRNGLGISQEKISELLRAFPGVKPYKHRIGKGERKWGYFLHHLLPIFQSYARDIWNAPPPDGGGSPSPNPEPPEPPGQDSGAPSPNPEKSPSDKENKEKPPFRGSNLDHPGPPPANQVPEPIGGVVQVTEENLKDEFGPQLGPPLKPSESTLKQGWSKVVQVVPPKNEIFLKPPPPSTPAAGFCTPTHPERYIGVDLETFYPWPSDGEISNEDRRRRKDGKAHPYAKDPRRNAIRLLSIHDGTEVRVFDLFTETVPDDVRDLLRNSTLIIHNADFDITALRRHGFEVSSSIFDTLLAAQLLSLGEVEPKRRKQKSPENPDSDEDFDREEEGTEFEKTFVPVSNEFSAVIERYLGTKMEKATSKLGGSDWSCASLTPAQLAYARDDATHFQALRIKLTEELHSAGQWENFRERSEFLIHLNNVKFAGIPVDREMLQADKTTSEELIATTKAELREMFKDYRPLVPKSRRKKTKLKGVSINGAVFGSGPSTEEINPGYHVHIKAALAAHGIVVENTQKATLSAIDSAETRAFCRYNEQTKLLSIIKGIEKSIFHDGRVRSAQWNQLVARSGRIIPREPNVQQLPRKWRKPFRVLAPWFWLKMDLSQIEIYILAIHCQCPYLIELLQSGKDIYVLIAAEIFGKVPQRGEGKNQVSETLRETTKTLVLGIAYCLMHRSFIRRVEIATRPSFGVQGVLYSLEDAQQFYAKFFEMFPEVKLYQDRMFEDALTEDFVYTATGQRRFLPPLLDDEEPNGYSKSRSYRHHVLVNTPIQGGAACHYIRSINKLIPRLPAPVELVHLIHDEVGLLVTQETAQATIEAVTLSFQEAFTEIFGSQLSVKLEPQLSGSWAKLAKEKK